MFGPDDFDNLESIIDEDEEQNYDTFSNYAISIGELIYLTDMDIGSDRFKFMMSVVNILMLDCEDESSIPFQNLYDFILAIAMHLAISIQMNENSSYYKQILNDEIIPKLSKGVGN